MAGKEFSDSMYDPWGRGSDLHRPIYGNGGFPSDEQWRNHGGFAPDIKGDDWHRPSGGTKVPRKPKPKSPSGGAARHVEREKVGGAR